MVKKSFRNKLIGLGLTLSFAAAGVGLALGGSPCTLEADADFAPSSVGYPYGLHIAGSLWRFKYNPDILTFPILNNIGLSGSIYEQGRTTNFVTVFNLKFTGDSLVFDDGGSMVFTVTSSTAYKFSFYINTDTFLNTISNISYSESDRTLLIDWLSNNCDLLEPPTDDIPENGLSMSDNTTLLFFRLSDLLTEHANDSLSFYDLDRNSNLYVDFSSVQYLMPYSVDFYDTSNGFRISNIRFVGTTGSNFFYSGLPFLFERDGVYVWQYGYKFDPAGSSSSIFSLHSTYFYSHWGYACAFRSSSSSNMTFGFAPSALIDYFSNEFTGNSAYAYLERIRPYINAFLGYSQFVYGDGVSSYTYDKGYQAGYTDGNKNGNDEGYKVGYKAGYDQGVTSVTSGTSAIVSLFGGVASVPMSILNGLGAFTIWNVPIISILSTFLFIALIAWVIRKLIA